MTPRSPVILLGFDSTEIEVIDRLVAAGRMPALADLRCRGRYGRLVPNPPQFLSQVWSTFFASQRLGDHAWYFGKLWNPDRQRLEYVHPRWLPLQPFWSSLDPSYRLVLLDPPFLSALPVHPNTTFLAGWQNHDDFGRRVVPGDLWDRLKARYGPARLKPEVFGPQTGSTLVAQRLEVLETNRQFGDICCDMLRSKPCDLFLAVFGAVHRGTHYLWDLSQIDSGRLDQPTLELLRGARDECYESFDRELGRIMDAAPEGSRLVAFSLHGMTANDGWYERLAQIVGQIHRGGKAEPPARKGLLFRAKQVLPWTLVRQVTRRIPQAWNAALVPLWSRRMFDWSRTRYFTLPMDYNGSIRLNVAGRDREGCVAPTEVPGIIEELDRALRSFRDIETGRHVIQDVLRVDDLVGAGAPYRRFLPDLVTLWHPPHPVSHSSGVVSDRYGEVRWPLGERFKSGRSGNHTQHGWFAAAGPGIQPGVSARSYDTVDVMPTVFEWLGAPRPPHFVGQPIAELLGES